MADYEKVFVRAIYSANSDYSEPKYDSSTLTTTATPTYSLRCGEMKIATSAVTVMALDELASVDTLLVKNLDGTNFVTLAYNDAAGNNQAVNVLAGGILLVQDVDPTTAGVTLTADTAACECFVYLSGT